MRSPIRIAIIGPSCSGKTTLGRQLSEGLALPRVELDELHWLADWQPRETDDFKRVVTETTEAENWVVDGSYFGKLGRLVTSRATLIIRLNLPFHIVYARILKRSLQRIVTREVLWNGNRESLLATLFDRDSLIYWVPRTWRSRNTRYGQLLSSLDPATELLEFKDLKSLQQWLQHYIQRQNNGLET
jgi:adenylate kinase family enzyme